MCQNVFFPTKIRKIFWRGSQPPHQTHPPMGRGYPISTPHPPSAPAAPRPLPYNPEYTTAIGLIKSLPLCMGISSMWPDMGKGMGKIKEQESCDIAKMTAQCALHMGALKIFGTPWLCPRPLFPTFSWAFVPIDPMNVPTKFEVRSFTCFWDKRGS